MDFPDLPAPAFARISDFFGLWAMAPVAFAFNTVAWAVMSVCPSFTVAVAWAVDAPGRPLLIDQVPRCVAQVPAPQFAGSWTGRVFNADPVVAARAKSSHVSTVGAPDEPSWSNPSSDSGTRPPSVAADAVPMSATASTATTLRAPTARTAQPEITRDTPLTDVAATGVVSVMLNALVATVIAGAAWVVSSVAPLRRLTDAALPLQAALTPVKFTADTWYCWAVALYDVV